jgi:hypothetical protein
VTDIGRLEFSFYAILARYTLLRHHSTAFQSFFVEVGKYRWGSDFEGRRPQGPLGDKKCDGYQPSTQTVFQSYAPRAMDAKALTEKIEEDFNGAIAHRATTPMKRWILVHNDHDELPTTAHELIISLREKHKGDIEIEVWGPERLLEITMDISPTGLRLLFPEGMSDAVFGKSTTGILTS